ncbi:hypothetical protein DAPPUDRAFT_112332 [Daphnia pulex]|uniref:Uncharacterized protein n=1 Tax=Daphnia pulex TaxID=6669 RepID=E9HBP7_DAPPU|nr:hypothetical protein DAPPUDRAFT_112332 [Daphnia pulex]|eukprot:EFX70881.1 hypothetical protein DAPPUDRAFT_112332 [Daphnia pulex]
MGQVGGNDEAKRDKSDGEYERDDDDPVALETEGNREEDDSSFDDESLPKIRSDELIIPLKSQYDVLIVKRPKKEDCHEAIAEWKKYEEMLAASIKSEKSVDDVDENNKTLIEDTLWTEAVEKIRERQETRVLDFLDQLSDDEAQ